MNIALWSGPRNVSTAMMRSWEARGDFAVTDEPLYAHYLLHTGIQHPGREEIIASQSVDPDKITSWLCGSPPGGKTHWLQKHMCHHLLDGMNDGWLTSLQHLFLIRDPIYVISSYARTRENITLQDLGYKEQLRILNRVVDMNGALPPIIDSVDLLRDPGTVLSKACHQLGIRYTDKMMQWSPGLRSTDGCWAKHWYRSVSESDSFQAHKPRPASVPRRYKDLLQEAEVFYKQLHRNRIR